MSLLKKLQLVTLSLLTTGTGLVAISFDSLEAKAESVNCNTEWATEAIEYLIDRAGYRPPFLSCYEIEAGDTEYITLTISGRHIRNRSGLSLMAECDSDCEDIDLRVYDASGELIAEDTSSNSFASLSLNNVRQGQTIDIEMDMYNCGEDYCGAVLATTPADVWRLLQ